MDLSEIKETSEQFFQTMIDARRHFHRFPELGEHEFSTQKYILDFCEFEGVACEKIAETGVVAVVFGDLEGGNVVALRADIDALPIQEISTKDYSSQNDGVMHACGHDVHTAVNLGLLKFFSLNRKKFRGAIKFFFQPSEETIGGAQRMVKEGCLERPKVDFVTGFHVMPYLPYDKIEVKYDTLNSSATTMTLTVRGVSGHGAYPELSIDAVVISAQIVLALQTIVSRNVSPLENAVITVGKISGGTASNVVASLVTLVATVRSSTPEVEKTLKDRITQVSQGIASSMGGSCDVVENDFGYPPLVNETSVVDVIIEAGNEALDADSVLMKKHPSMGGEDFSYFLENAKGAFFSVGCKVSDKPPYSLHTADFEVDERCMKTAFVVQAHTTLKLINKNI